MTNKSRPIERIKAVSRLLFPPNYPLPYVDPALKQACPFACADLKPQSSYVHLLNCWITDMCHHAQPQVGFFIGKSDSLNYCCFFFFLVVQQNLNSVTLCLLSRHSTTQTAPLALLLLSNSLKKKKKE